MARKTVLPSALSPEQQRALSVFLKSLSEYDSLSLIKIPCSVLPTDFRCIMKGKIPKNALVCEDHWSWNQSNAKIRTVTDNGLEVIIQKLNPRKKPETMLKRPSYKIWILAFRKTTDEVDPELFVWCEKGISRSLFGNGEGHGVPAQISAKPEMKSFPFTATPPSFSAALLDAMEVDTPSEDATDRFLRQIQQEGQCQTPKREVKPDVSSQPCTHLHSQPIPHYHCSDSMHGPFHHAASSAPTHTRHQSLDSPFSAPVAPAATAAKPIVADKRSRSYSHPVCTTKLPPLFEDPSWDEGDEVMMDYVAADEPSYCSTALTTVVHNEVVVTMDDLAFLKDFVVPQESCPFGVQCRQW